MHIPVDCYPPLYHFTAVSISWYCSEWQEYLEAVWCRYNSEVFPLLRDANISIWDTYNVTLPLWQYHMWERDCTHFCHPSAYEVWTFLLFKHLESHGALVEDAL